MDFIAAVTTLLSTTLTSPASPILQSLRTLGRRISNYRSHPSSATAAAHTIATSPFIKFLDEQTRRGLPFSCIGHLTTPGAPGQLFDQSGEASDPRLCLGGRESTSELRFPHDWTVCSIFGVQCWTFLAT